MGGRLALESVAGLAWNTQCGAPYRSRPQAVTRSLGLQRLLSTKADMTALLRAHVVLAEPFPGSVAHWVVPVKVRKMNESCLGSNQMPAQTRTSSLRGGVIPTSFDFRHDICWAGLGWAGLGWAAYLILATSSFQYGDRLLLILGFCIVQGGFAAVVSDSQIRAGLDE